MVAILDLTDCTIVFVFSLVLLLLSLYYSRKRKACASVCRKGLSYYDYTPGHRCLSVADQRCAGGNCTEHCREHCRGICLDIWQNGEPKADPIKIETLARFKK
jgi:hypothetical protein